MHWSPSLRSMRASRQGELMAKNHLSERSAPVFEPAGERLVQPSPWRLEASWVDSTADLRAVQRLRYRIFAGEMKASLDLPAGTPPGHDADRFDDHCAHLVVRSVSTADERSEVVGTYRVLTPDAARRAGGFYSETEFDLAPLSTMRSRMAELGRSCIDPAWRTGSTILVL